MLVKEQETSLGSTVGSAWLQQKTMSKCLQLEDTTFIRHPSGIPTGPLGKESHTYVRTPAMVRCHHGVLPRHLARLAPIVVLGLV